MNTDYSTVASHVIFLLLWERLRHLMLIYTDMDQHSVNLVH